MNIGGWMIVGGVAGFFYLFGRAVGNKEGEAAGKKKGKAEGMQAAVFEFQCNQSGMALSKDFIAAAEKAKTQLEGKVNAKGEKKPDTLSVSLKKRWVDWWLGAILLIAFIAWLTH
jgi:hypothetical protein